MFFIQCVCSVVPITSCRVSPTSVLCQECIRHSLATHLSLLLHTHRPAGTFYWDESEKEKKEDVSYVHAWSITRVRKRELRRDNAVRDNWCKWERRPSGKSVKIMDRKTEIFLSLFGLWRWMITELSDHRQESEILPPIWDEADTKDTKCQRGCAALIKGWKKCSTE